MTENERQDFANVVFGVFEVFGHECNSTVARAWWQALNDLELSDIKIAVAKIIKYETHGYRPLPGKVRELVGERVESQAMMAWQELNAAIVKVGSYRTPKFTDARIPAIINQHGGWVRICGITTDEFDNWFRKSFFADYQTISDEPELIPRLAGLTAIGNHKGDPIALGGLVAKAKAEWGQ